MNNDIITLLNINDEDVEVKKIVVEGDKKIITIQKKLKKYYCPCCNTRLNSKGLSTRMVNHPITQDGYHIIIELKQRRWFCPNNICDYRFTEQFSFVERYKHNTNMTPIMILNELKDIHLTAAYVANKFNVSDTYVHNVVLQYLDIKRLKLPRILSIDEVYIDFDYTNRYCMVLMNWETGDIVDLLPNRSKTVYENYFLNIPLEERDSVEYVICDMYNSYINFSPQYFRYAKTIIDSFHVIQWLIHAINIYVNNVKKKYQKKDEERLKQKNYETNHDNKSIIESHEIYILNKHRWVILKNVDEIKYDSRRHWDYKLHQYLDTYDYEKYFLALDPNFIRIREEKELYIKFNSSFPKSHEVAEKELDDLILHYSKSDIYIFRDFSVLLTKYKVEIIRSFYDINDHSPTEAEIKLRRLSNGPMEGFNRFPKDLKRQSRGVENFEYTRNRIIWSNRKHEPIRINPKSEKDIHTYTHKTRGKYKNNN